MVKYCRSELFVAFVYTTPYAYTHNATIRQEYVKCGNPDCQNSHDPYLYAYWKADNKLNKRYVGKNFEAFRLRQIAKEIKLRPSILVKFKFIEQQASKGNVLAKQYLEKIRMEEASIDWAHRGLINSIRQQRMLKMMTIADNRHLKMMTIWKNSEHVYTIDVREKRRDGEYEPRGRALICD